MHVYGKLPRMGHIYYAVVDETFVLNRDINCSFLGCKITVSLDSKKHLLSDCGFLLTFNKYTDRDTIQHHLWRFSLIDSTKRFLNILMVKSFPCASHGYIYAQ